MLDLYKNIKSKRLELGWSQTELAKRVGYSDKSMIAKVESGKVDLSQSKISLFARILGCTESELMGYDPIEQEMRNYLANHPGEKSMYYEILGEGWRNYMSENEYALIKQWREADELTRKMIAKLLCFPYAEEN